MKELKLIVVKYSIVGWDDMPDEHLLATRNLTRKETETVRKRMVSYFKKHEDTDPGSLICYAFQSLMREGVVPYIPEETYVG